MKSDHLSDSEIQEWAISKSLGIHVQEHLHECHTCKERVGMYQHMITGIKMQPSVEFDFNISELVISRLEKNKPSNSYTGLFWLFAIIGTSAIVIAGYLFGKYMANLFSGNSDMSIYLALIITVGLFLSQGIEMVRKYKRQMDATNFI